MPTNHSMCASDSQLVRFIATQLGPEDEQRIQSHLDACRDCQTALERLSADAQLWSDLPGCLAGRSSVQDGASLVGVHPPVSEAVVEQLLAFLSPTEFPNSLGRIGGYEVTGLVGHGGTGAVFKAFDPSLNRFVAVKVLSPSLSDNAAARKRFEQEGRAIAAVTHGHVVAIYAVDDHRGLPYLVMQYVAGASLQHRLDSQGTLQICEVVRIAMQVASGIAAAHAQGIVHRDIKPANILLEHGMDRAIVGDFGLARVADSASHTLSGLIAGTPSYMSPEQVQGGPVDERSDLFSLGGVIFAMCVGHPPFRAETIYGLLRRICDDAPRALREQNPAVPEWLDALVMMLLSKPPDDRFVSAEEVSILLKRELAHMQNPVSVAVPKRRWLEAAIRKRRHGPSRWIRPVASTVVLVAAVASGWGLALLLNGGMSPQRAHDKFANSSWTGDEIDNKKVSLTPPPSNWVPPPSPAPSQSKLIQKTLADADARETEGIPFADYVATIKKTVPNLQRKFNVPGVSVALVNGPKMEWSTGFGVVHEGGDDPVTANTVMEACSMSKPFFAYLVMQMVEQGKFNLDRPLVKYLNRDYLENDVHHRKITARMVLSHTSGLPNWRPTGPQADDFLTRHHWQGGMLNLGAPLELAFTPGKRFGYSGEGFLMLQRVLEQRRGETLTHWAKQGLIDPLGLQNTSFQWRPEFADDVAHGHDGNGKEIRVAPFEYANAAYSLYTSAADYAQFLKEMMALRPSAKHSLSAATRREMLTLQEPVHKSEGKYGLGWRIQKINGQVVASHSGTNEGYRCAAYFLPGMQHGLVIMTNADSGLGLIEALGQELDRIR